MRGVGGFYLERGAVEVLGLSGKARSGKDFLAQKVAVPLGFMPLALANHFKVSAIAKGLEDLPVEAMDIRQMWEIDKDDLHRKALQLEGTERGRKVYGDDIWCRHLEAWMYYFALKGYRRFVVTDVRFPNEVEWVKSLGGKVYRIVGRGGITNGVANHDSESSLDDYKGFDRVLDNSPENEDRVLDVMRAALFVDFPSLAEEATPVVKEA